MIILDTNVLSELMRLDANKDVLRWILSTPSNDLFTTTITQAEILAGIAILPTGRRRAAILTEAENSFADFSSGRILTFDSAAAEEYAILIADRRRSGRPIQPFDAQIAAIARAHRADLATRNIKDFVDAGIRVINPWEADP